MSFSKFTTFKIDKDDFEVISSELIKTAAFKLPDGINYDPDYLYMKVKAVSAGEYWGDNKNKDYFPEAELINNYKTFLSAHTFKNHDNKRIEAAIGDVLKADWNDKMKAVYLLIRIDRRIAPTIVRGFEKGFMTDVSMGCRVDHVICSYCGKKAKTKLDYCEHLKTMKGKIFNDGRKVYEINIGPKFHDISAVLNGAERTAKAEGLYFLGDKVAYSLPNNSMEKCASFEDSMNEVSGSLTNSNSQDINTLIYMLSDKMSACDKVASEDKIAEFKKEVQGKVMSSSLKAIADKNINNFEKISSLLKLLYTKYWNKEKCISIALKIKEIAKANSTTPVEAFNQFLQVCDFANIELSPVEVHDIFNEVIDVDSFDLRNIPCTPENNIIEDSVDFGMKSMNMPCNMASMLRVCSTLGNMFANGDTNEFTENPVVKIKAVLSNSNGYNDTFNDTVGEHIMESIVKDLLHERSNHRTFLLPRLKNIADGSIQPIHTNHHHFAPIKVIRISKTSPELSKIVLPAILSSVIHGKYENDRVKRFNDGLLHRGINKFASYFDGCDFNNSLDSLCLEKTAGPIKRTSLAIAGIPLTHSYSALQRSRMNNGEDISSLNRYVAENPSNAAFLNSALIYYLGGKGNKAINFIASKGKNFAKKADEYNEEDMFKNANIDNLVISKNSNYSPNQLTIIKYATALKGVGMDDKADELLFQNNLNEDDLSEYLKTAEEYYKIEIEKSASNAFKTVVNSALGDMLFDNVKKTSVAAAIPGYIADGIILTGMTKGLERSVNKNLKGDVKNE